MAVCLCVGADAQSVSMKVGGAGAHDQQDDSGSKAINLAIARHAAGTTNVAATPEFSIPAGYYAGAQNISIIDSTPGATIYYTMDGSYPSTSSAVYAGPVRLTGTTTLVAMAAAPGYGESPLAFATYFVGTAKTPYIYTIAGTDFFGYGGDGGPAAEAMLSNPEGAAVDSAGNVYIADSQNNRIRKIDALTGNISTVAGTGVAGYSGDDGPALNAQLYFPAIVAVDSKGAIYVSDENNNVVRRIDPSTGTISTYAGNPHASSLGDGGPATGALLVQPTGITFDKSDNLYICSLDRVRKVNARDGTISTVAGSGLWGASGDGGPAVSASMANPTAVAVFSGILYIADEFNNAIRAVNLKSGIITTYAGVLGGPVGFGGDGGPATSAKFFYPQGVALDPEGNLYIVDTYNFRIRKVYKSTGLISTATANTNACFSFNSDGSTATSSAMCYMTGLTSDPNGNLYIADTSSSRIRKLTARVAPPTTFTATPVLSLADGTYASAQTLTITDPSQGAAIYVSASGGPPPTGVEAYHGSFEIPATMTISAVAVAPGLMPSAPAQATYTITAKPRAVVKKLAGDGTPGFSGAGGPALSAEMQSPGGLAVDNLGHEYICDTQNNVIWRVDESTGKIGLLAGTGMAGYSGDEGPAKAATLNRPAGVAVDDRGHVFIADENNHVVREVMIGTGMIRTVAGNGTTSYSGSHGPYGDGGPATEALIYPKGVAAIGGDLYIADNLNRVRKVHLSTGIIETVAGGGSEPAVDGAVATAVFINGPTAVAVDVWKNIYFPGGYQIWKVDAETGRLTVVAGNGTFGSTGDGLPALDAQLDASALTVDRAGNIYISTFPEVRKVDAKTGVISRLAGMDFGGVGSTGTVPALAAGLCPTAAIAVDASNQLYVGDQCNDGVFKISFTIPAGKPTFSLAEGTYSGPQSITLKSISPEATIFYTTDGSTPSLTSMVYSGPITLTNSATIKAMAASPGFAPSVVSSATYTITP